MRTFKNPSFALMLCWLPACGQQLVEFPADRADAAASSADDDTENADDDTGNADDDTGNADDDTGNPDDDTGNPDDDTGNPDDDVDDSDDDVGSPDDDAGAPDDDVGSLDDDVGDPDDDVGSLDDDASPDDDAGAPDDDIDSPDGGEPNHPGHGDRDAGDADAGDPDSGTPGDASDGAPVVVSTNPDDSAFGVPIAKRLTAMFSEPMDPLTVDGATFTLSLGATPVPGTVSYDGANATASFDPLNDLELGATYTATISVAAEDATGIPMEADYTWDFATSACGQAKLVLGAADDFVVLAGSTVTSTGPTSVTGDLGVSPGTAVIGFPPGTLVGVQHAGDPTAGQAEADLTTAYDEAAGRTLCAVTVSGNIGGTTLTPGLYKSTSSLEISSGDLTLDAQGDPDSVFILQMASTLTTTSGRQVILAGGAKSSNVYWQVGTSATLGSTSAFHGTVMADQAITLETGASLNGRVLARIAAVSLDSNAITKPAP